ncbi:hypothetical protein BX600DRAFT_447394 [Xylariales sp. PMI_506]|nr:hypothetical protein BX600DRAFT_447394 [Xylariales sp. PMI_506]
MASDAKSIVVFDTPSQDGRTWSHHVLRILFSAHYKGIPFSIQSVEYPDIISTFSSTSLKPKDDPVEPYEIPVVQFPTPTGDPKYIMDTVGIIQAFEEMEPERSLLYASPRSVEFRSRFPPVFAPILQFAVGHVPNVLSERSTDFFKQKRQARWGKSVEQWIVEHPISDGLAVVEPRLKEFGDWLEQTPGPFVNGDQVGYADFAVVSFLGYVKAVGLADAFKQLIGMHPAVERLYNAVKITQLGNAQCQDLFEN